MPKISKKRQDIIESACKIAIKEFEEKNPFLIKRDSSLKPSFYSVAFMRIWKLYKKGKINWKNKNILQFLKWQAKWAIQDEIREYLVPITRQEQKKLKMWECCSCGYKTNYYQHVEREKRGDKFCVCGATIFWYFDEAKNPMNVIKKFTEVADSPSDYAAITNIPERKNSNIVDIKDEVKYFMDRLPEKHKEIIIKRIFNESSIDELAKSYNVTKSRIHTKIHQAIKHCKELNNARMAIS